MTSPTTRLLSLLPLRAAAAAAADKATIAAGRRSSGDARAAVELPVTASAAAEAHPLRKASTAGAAVAVRETLKEVVAADSQRPSQRPQSPVEEAGCAPPQRVAS